MRILSLWTFVTTLALTILLTACSVLSPVTPVAESAYLIKTLPRSISVKSPHNLTILVLQPTAASLYDTRNMAYSSAPFRIDYYAKNHWADTPANMLLPLLIQTLQQSHYFKAVVSSPYTGPYNYLLTTEITELLQDYTNQQPVLRISLRAQLTNGVTGKIMSVKEFSAIKVMSSKNPYAGVLAANEATADILQQLAQWVTAN